MMHDHVRADGLDRRVSCRATIGGCLLAAAAIVGSGRALRGLFAGPDAPVKRGPRGKLVVRASVTR